jgi:hypothetical protein
MMTIEELRLTLHKFAAQSLISEGAIKQLAPEQLQTFLMYMAEDAAYSLRLLFTVPGIEAPQTPICSYPATWWDHLKARLGWKHERTWVYRETIVTLPDVPLPERWREGARLAIRYTTDAASDY